MSDGTRCDGCKEMIDKDGEPYLELDLRWKDEEGGANGRRYVSYSSAGEKHFHGRPCLQLWVDCVGWWDGRFGDDAVLDGGRVQAMAAVRKGEEG